MGAFVPTYYSVRTIQKGENKYAKQMSPAEKRAKDQEALNAAYTTSRIEAANVAAKAEAIQPYQNAVAQAEAAKQARIDKYLAKYGSFKEGERENPKIYWYQFRDDIHRLEQNVTSAKANLSNAQTAVQNQQTSISVISPRTTTAEGESGWIAARRVTPTETTAEISYAQYVNENPPPAGPVDSPAYRGWEAQMRERTGTTAEAFATPKGKSEWQYVQDIMERNRNIPQYQAQEMISRGQLYTQSEIESYGTPSSKLEDTLHVSVDLGDKENPWMYQFDVSSSQAGNIGTILSESYNSLIRTGTIHSRPMNLEGLHLRITGENEGQPFILEEDISASQLSNMPDYIRSSMKYIGLSPTKISAGVIGSRPTIKYSTTTNIVPKPIGQSPEFLMQAIVGKEPTNLASFQNPWIAATTTSRSSKGGIATVAVLNSAGIPITYMSGRTSWKEITTVGGAISTQKTEEEQARSDILARSHIASENLKTFETYGLDLYGGVKALTTIYTISDWASKSTINILWSASQRLQPELNKYANQYTALTGNKLYGHEYVGLAAASFGTGFVAMTAGLPATAAEYGFLVGEVVTNPASLVRISLDFTTNIATNPIGFGFELLGGGVGVNSLTSGLGKLGTIRTFEAERALNIRKGKLTVESDRMIRSLLSFDVKKTVTGLKEIKLTNTPDIDIATANVFNVEEFGTISKNKYIFKPQAITETVYAKYTGTRVVPTLELALPKLTMLPPVSEYSIFTTEIPRRMTVPIGQTAIASGPLTIQSGGIFGLFKRTYTIPTRGKPSTTIDQWAPLEYQEGKLVVPESEYGPLMFDESMPSSTKPYIATVNTAGTFAQKYNSVTVFGKEFGTYLRGEKQYFTTSKEGTGFLTTRPSTPGRQSLIGKGTTRAGGIKLNYNMIVQIHDVTPVRLIEAPIRLQPPSGKISKTPMSVTFDDLAMNMESVFGKESSRPIIKKSAYREKLRIKDLMNEIKIGRDNEGIMKSKLELSSLIGKSGTTAKQDTTQLQRMFDLKQSAIAGASAEALAVGLAKQSYKTVSPWGLLYAPKAAYAPTPAGKQYIPSGKQFIPSGMIYTPSKGKLTKFDYDEVGFGEMNLNIIGSSQLPKIKQTVETKYGLVSQLTQKQAQTTKDKQRQRLINITTQFNRTGERLNSITTQAQLLRSIQPQRINVSQLTNQLGKQRQGSTQWTGQRNKPGEPTPNEPIVKVPTLPPINISNDLSSIIGKSKRSIKQPKRYTPSLVSMEFGIRGKQPKKLTGLEIRPMANIPGFTSTRKRRKKR